MMMENVVALVCLQAQQVAGLPAAAEGRQILLHLVQQQQREEEEQAAAAARCRAGVAAFHGQVLLLHCTPVDGITSVAVRVSFHPRHHDYSTSSDPHRIDLAAQLHCPSPIALSFVVLDGAVLSLVLHHRLIRRRRSACLPLLLNCLRTPTVDPQDDDSRDGDLQDQSSSGFITIEKGTISRRRPPSDNLLTTDDEAVDDRPGKPMALLAEELEVENEFLAKLEGSCDGDDDVDLDALIKHAEAELRDLYL